MKIDIKITSTPEVKFQSQIEAGWIINQIEVVLMKEVSKSIMKESFDKVEEACLESFVRE